MKLRSLIFAITAIALLCMLSISGCRKPNDVIHTPGAFAIMGNTANNSSRFVLEADSLTGGVITAVGAGADVSVLNADGINMKVKNGFYYNLNLTRFGKYKYANNTLEPVIEIPNTFGFAYIYVSLWIDDNTLLMTANNTAETEFRYAIVNVNTMTVESKGAFPLPPIPVANHKLRTGTLFKRNDRLFIGYAYYSNASPYNILDSVYVTAVDYPAMTNPVHLKDARSAGGGASVTQYSVMESNGDIYMMSVPSDHYGLSAKPTVILRIKNGEEIFDSTYTFNVSALVNNDDPLSLTGIGYGKAITKNARQDLIAGFNDFYAGFIYEYYVVDYINQTMTKINTPLHAGMYTNVVLHDGKAYFVVNSQSQGIYVYCYDPATGITTKGLEIQGVNNVDWVYKL